MTIPTPTNAISSPNTVVKLDIWFCKMEQNWVQTWMSLFPKKTLKHDWGLEGCTHKTRKGNYCNTNKWGGESKITKKMQNQKSLTGQQKRSCKLVLSPSQVISAPLHPTPTMCTTTPSLTQVHTSPSNVPKPATDPIMAPNTNMCTVPLPWHEQVPQRWAPVTYDMYTDRQRQSVTLSVNIIWLGNQCQ